MNARAADVLHELESTHSTPDRPRKLVGIALLIAAASFSVLLVLTWRRSRVYEYRSSRDGLTDVANRRQLERDLDVRAPELVAVLMIDIDHFKVLNDSYGHAAGDRALVAVAGAISSALRSGDVVYRYGGEEFCALLPDADLDTAAAVAERMRSAVELLDFTGAEYLDGARLTVSVGVGVGTPRPTVVDADRALYAAKTAGRNRIMLASQVAG